MKCPFCNGDGWWVEPEHGPNCTGDECKEPCPVPIQVICRNCEGKGTTGDE